jgi:hypothetical protein
MKIMKNIFIALTIVLIGTTIINAQNANGFYFYEDFESETTFAQWSTHSISGTSVWGLNSGLTYGNYNDAFEGSYNASYDSYNYNNDQAILVSPSIDLSQSTNPVLSFHHIQPIWSSDQDELQVYYKSSSQSEWILLKEYAGNINSWTEQIVVLPDASSDYYIGFSAKSGYGYGVGIDNVSIYKGEACDNPKNLQFVNIKETSAHLRWFAVEDVIYEMEYGFSGYAAGNGTRISNLFSNNAHINNLEGLTSYDVYIRAYCSEGVSSWTGPYTFTTTCVISQNLPYTESFENPENPMECWQLVYANSNHPQGNNVIIDNTMAVTGQKSLRFSSYEVGYPYDQYLISPLINIPAYTEFSFKYRTIENSQESFSVGFSSSSTNAFSNLNWTDEVIDADENWKIAKYLIPEDAKYIIIHYSSVYEYYLYIDDIRIGLPIECNIAQDLEIIEKSQNHAVLTWFNTEDVMYVEYGLTGFVKGSGEEIYSVENNQTIIQNLSLFTNYDAYVITDCEGIPMYSDAISFFTDGQCDPVNNLDTIEVNITTAKIAWFSGDYYSKANIEYGLSGFELGSGIQILSYTSEYVLINLDEDTYYDVYVQAVCSDFDGIADWSDKLSFKTKLDSEIEDDDEMIDEVIDLEIEEEENEENEGFLISIYTLSENNYICDYDTNSHFIDLIIKNEGTKTILGGTAINYYINYESKFISQIETIVLTKDLHPNDSFYFTSNQGFEFTDETNSISVVLSDNFKNIANNTVTIHFTRIIQELYVNSSSDNIIYSESFPLSLYAEYSSNISESLINNVWEWSNGENSNSVFVFDSGQISVKVSNEYCYITKNLTIINPDIEEEENGSNYEVFPGSSDGQINILVNDSSIPVSLDVYDSIGRLVYSAVLSTAANQVDLSNYAAGVYSLKFTLNNYVELIRIYLN